jgi:hypothetical protein
MMAEILPSAGGSYERLKDGSLKLIEEVKLAEALPPKAQPAAETK